LFILDYHYEEPKQGGKGRTPKEQDHEHNTGELGDVKGRL